MKTEIERVCEIVEMLLAHEPIIDVPYEQLNDIAVALVQEGYGDISEYKSEIEQLEEETNNIRKGAAKEILQTLYGQCYEINDETGESMGNFVSDDDILCLAKH